ncbi:MAG: prepilin-type N-terminal cleavage/methylation domain-containing protein, partial [Nitrospira sp.]|nr:prepilin-type N-terminal cleavage/methylation domain-containing protein [Nitrospira sp.]
MGNGIMALVFSWLAISTQRIQEGRCDHTESVEDLTETRIRRLKRFLLCTRGFTFTELIIVLGIIGVILMFAQTW